MKFSGKFEPTIGIYKTRLRNKFSKCKLYDVTINHKEWITEIEIIRGDLQNMDVKIDDS